MPTHLRHVKLLEAQLTKMDKEYDECNNALAQGEVSNYDDAFPRSINQTSMAFMAIVFTKCQFNVGSIKIPVFALRFIADATAKMKAATLVC